MRYNGLNNMFFPLCLINDNHSVTSPSHTKKTKSDTDAPTEFIRLDESVAALWKLWAHALGQINMTGAMKAKVQAMLDNFSYDLDHIK